jgi:aminopeptidase
MEDMFFRSTLRDWDADAAAMEGLRSRLERGSEVTIRTSGTDLTFSTAGRRYVIGAGTHNVPDGEIYTAPVESSVEGHVTFNLPAVYGGRRLDEVYLRFEGGQVVEASAKTNGELLEAVLNTDAGSRCLGEFGIGTNTAIDRYSYDILYDEKIGGTVHLALGRAYEECGGVNESAIHWDLVLDLRNAGEVVVDGTPVFREGRWVDES